MSLVFLPRFGKRVSFAEMSKGRLINAWEISNGLRLDLALKFFCEFKEAWKGWECLHGRSGDEAVELSWCG